ncbi:MAG: creatininase family protein [Proteobacteria bacterium]|nr:creatininase family protein [Pseudomonadota bacterium]
MYLSDITMKELKNNIKKCPIVIVPLGSLEEHGPHLPLATDTIQIIEILKTVEKKTGVFIAPPINYGVCRSTEDHTGTVGISADTLRSLITDLLMELKRQGFKAVFFISGHAGKLHSISIIEACEKFIKANSDIRVFYFSELELMGKELSGIIETDFDSHAGEIETSRMLYIDRNLVKGDITKIPADKPAFPAGEIIKDKLKYWKSGVWGDPTKANIEKGEKTLTLSANKITEIIKKVKRELSSKP